MRQADFALFNIGQLVTVAAKPHAAAVGPLGIIERAAVAARDGKIVWLGPLEDFHREVEMLPDATLVNTHGRTVLPGFVDPHTHPIFAGERAGEFYARAAGTTYGDQLESGGIMSTVRATRAAGEDELLARGYHCAETFLRHGTTTIEGKSGYGLTLSDELKILRVLNRLQRVQSLKIVPAFLGAHVVPGDYAGTADDYVRELTEEWLPEVRDYAPICDVWCEAEAFSADQCRIILERAQKLGFQLTAHANELGPTPGVRLAAGMGALSVDHAIYLDDEDIDALRESGTVPVLLPGTTFFLGSDQYAPARRLLDAGVPVALGTDFNPGTSYTQNMQFILTLAVLKLGMSPEEAIAATTRESARAIGLGDQVGTLEVDKYCDCSVFTVTDYRQLAYAYAMNQVETVIAGGQVVVRDGTVSPVRVAAAAG